MTRFNIATLAFSSLINVISAKQPIDDGFYTSIRDFSKLGAFALSGYQTVAPEITAGQWAATVFGAATTPQDIADALCNSLAGAMESALMGHVPANPLATAEGQIETLFRDFLDKKQMDNLVNGVPTEAAKAGVNHRFKSGHGPENRPSFIDTGLYQSAFKVWSDLP